MNCEARDVLKPALLLGSMTCALIILGPTPIALATDAWAPSELGEPLVLERDPLWNYNNFFAYDENVEHIPLTEALAMKELSEIVRLRKLGVHLDYYVMDDDWFETTGAYRILRKSTWPNGPDRWLAECKRLGIKPGLWLPTNSIPSRTDMPPQWRDSVADTEGGGKLASLFEGGYLSDLMDVLQLWYDRGIRMFKFDGAFLGAATTAAKMKFSSEEIVEKNRFALLEAMKAFRRKNPEVLFVAYNGFGGDINSTVGPFPFKDPVDLRLLEAFDSIYSGDPRIADVPMASFYRSMDIYSDHMVRRYEQSFVPLERIDSASFVLSDTASNSNRKRAPGGTC